MRLVSFFDLRYRPARAGPGSPSTGAVGGERRRRRRASRSAVAIAVAVATCVALGGARGAEEARRGDPPPTAAEPGAKSLDFYFAALARARDEASAARTRESLEAHWRRSGSATADLLADRARRAAGLGETGLALDLLDATIVVAPQWAGARFERALVHLGRHDPDRARADLAATLALEPRHLGALAMLAALAEAAGQPGPALTWLRRLQGLDPRNPALGEGRLEKLVIDVEGREL